MFCKGQHPHDLSRSCDSTQWEVVWGNALKEEGRSITLWQCKQCKRVVMASQEWKDSDRPA